MHDPVSERHMQTPLKVPPGSAQLFKEVQCLSVVGDEHHLVTSCCPRHCQDVIENQHLP